MHDSTVSEGFFMRKMHDSTVSEPFFMKKRENSMLNLSFLVRDFEKSMFLERDFRRNSARERRKLNALVVMAKMQIRDEEA